MLIKQTLLSDLIKSNIPLGRQDNNGWYVIRCAYCNDYTTRGGFKFEDGYTSYSCFNCSAKFKYEEGSGKISHATKEILSSFGLDRNKLRDITSSLFLNKRASEDITLEDLKRPKLFTPEVALPPGSLPLLCSEHEEIQEPILNYLIKRNIDPTLTPFFFSCDKKMLNRVIIPYYRDGKVIYWQARHINDGVKPRYLNCTISKEAVIYGYDRLFEYDDNPLFVTEGVFNAVLLNGIAVMSGTLNAARLEILKKSRRRLIFVRDRDSNGDHLSQQAIDNGWEVTTVDSRVNDINDSVNRFGLPYTAYSLMRNIQKPENKISTALNLQIWGMTDRLKKMGR